MTRDNQLEPPPSDPAAPDEGGGQMTFFEHLVELRKRIINSLLAVLAGAALGWVVAPRFVNIITRPIRAALTGHKPNPQLVYTGPTDYLSLLIQLGLYIRIGSASPGILFQVRP